MKVFAFDCALAACSVAVLEMGEVRFCAVRPAGLGEAEGVIPMLAEAAAATAIPLAAADLIAVTVGPGTFSGIRIGLAAARGLALAGRGQVVAVSTLEALAAGVETLAGSRTILAVIDAGRGQVYAQAFAARAQPTGVQPAGLEPTGLEPTGLEPLGPPQCLEPAAAARLAGGAKALAVGNAASRLGGGLEIASGHDTPDPVQIARLGLQRWLGQLPALAAEPLYLRVPNFRLAGAPSKANTDD